MKHLLLLLLLHAMAFTVATAQTLSGTIVLEGGDNNPLATILVSDLGIGTTAKLDGSYRIAGIKPGVHTVEYSFVGYKTIKTEMTFAAGEAKTHDVTMELAPIMLNVAFATPDGSDPARYIARKALETAEKKYKALADFRFSTSTIVSSRDLDFVDEFLPPAAAKMTYMVAGLMGYKTMLKLLMKYPELDVVMSNSGTCAARKYKWGKETLARCNVTLSEKEKAALNVVKLSDNLFDQVYADNIMRSKKAKVRLAGSYLDGDNFVYIIEATKGGERDVMHVIDGTWDVKRFIKKVDIDEEVWELRRAVGNLYLPVSYNETLEFFRKDAKQIQAESEAREQQQSGKDAEKTSKLAERMAKRIMKRVERDESERDRLRSMAKRIEQRGINCSITRGATITYRR